MNSVWLMIQVLTGGHCPPSGTPCWACRKPSAPHWAGIMIYLAASDLWKFEIQLSPKIACVFLHVRSSRWVTSHSVWQCSLLSPLLHPNCPLCLFKVSFFPLFIPKCCCFVYFGNNSTAEILTLTLLKSSLVPQNSSLSLGEFSFPAHAQYFYSRVLSLPLHVHL